MSKNYKSKKKASSLGFSGKSVEAAPVWVRNCRHCGQDHELGKCAANPWG
jgi:hypothetical protein